MEYRDGIFVATSNSRKTSIIKDFFGQDLNEIISRPINQNIFSILNDSLVLRDMTISENGENIFFVVNKKGDNDLRNSHILMHNIESGVYDSLSPIDRFNGNLSMSSDGSLIAVKEKFDTIISIYDVKTNNLLKKLSTNFYSTNPQFSFDNQYIAYGGTIKSLVNDEEFPIGFSAIMFSPNGKYFICKMPFGRKRHQLWDLVNKKCVKKDLFSLLSFSPDSKYLCMLGEYENSIEIWDIETWECKNKIYLNNDMVGNIKGVEFSQNGRYIIIKYGNRFSIWDRYCGEHLYTPDINSIGSNQMFFYGSKIVYYDSQILKPRYIEFFELEVLQNKINEIFSNRRLTQEEKRKYLIE